MWHSFTADEENRATSEVVDETAGGFTLGSGNNNNRTAAEKPEQPQEIHKDGKHFSWICKDKM